jgi:hypothetical protein
MEITALGKLDQAVSDAAQLLGLGKRGLDPLMLEELRGQIAQQRTSVTGGSSQLPEGYSMAHGVCFMCCGVLLCVVFLKTA